MLGFELEGYMRAYRPDKRRHAALHEVKVMAFHLLWLSGLRLQLPLPQLACSALSGSFAWYDPRAPWAPLSGLPSSIGRVKPKPVRHSSTLTQRVRRRIPWSAAHCSSLQPTFKGIRAGVSSHATMANTRWLSESLPPTPEIDALNTGSGQREGCALRGSVRTPAPPSRIRYLALSSADSQIRRRCHDSISETILSRERRRVRPGARATGDGEHFCRQAHSAQFKVFEQCPRDRSSTADALSSNATLPLSPDPDFGGRRLNGNFAQFRQAQIVQYGGKERHWDADQGRQYAMLARLNEQLMTQVEPGRLQRQHHEGRNRQCGVC